MIHDGFYRLAETGSDDDAGDTATAARDTPGNPVERAFVGWEKGRNDDEREANRAIVVTATRWLRDHGGEVTKGDCPLDDWRAADTHPDAPRGDDALWNGTITAAWKATDAVESDYRSYKWVGE